MPASLGTFLAAEAWLAPLAQVVFELWSMHDGIQCLLHIEKHNAVRLCKCMFQIFGQAFVRQVHLCSYASFLFHTEKSLYADVGRVSCYQCGSISNGMRLAATLPTDPLQGMPKSFKMVRICNTHGAILLIKARTFSAATFAACI